MADKPRLRGRYREVGSEGSLSACSYPGRFTKEAVALQQEERLVVRF